MRVWTIKENFLPSFKRHFLFSSSVISLTDFYYRYNYSHWWGWSFLSIRVNMSSIILTLPETVINPFSSSKRHLNYIMGYSIMDWNDVNEWMKMNKRYKHSRHDSKTQTAGCSSCACDCLTGIRLHRETLLLCTDNCVFISVSAADTDSIKSLYIC